MYFLFGGEMSSSGGEVVGGYVTCGGETFTERTMRELQQRTMLSNF